MSDRDLSDEELANARTLVTAEQPHLLALVDGMTAEIRRTRASLSAWRNAASPAPTPEALYHTLRTFHDALDKERRTLERVMVEAGEEIARVRAEARLPVTISGRVRVVEHDDAAAYDLIASGAAWGVRDTDSGEDGDVSWWDGDDAERMARSCFAEHVNADRELDAPTTPQPTPTGVLVPAESLADLRKARAAYEEDDGNTLDLLLGIDDFLAAIDSVSGLAHPQRLDQHEPQATIRPRDDRGQPAHGGAASVVLPLVPPRSAAVPRDAGELRGEFRRPCDVAGGPRQPQECGHQHPGELEPGVGAGPGASDARDGVAAPAPKCARSACQAEAGPTPLVEGIVFNKMERGALMWAALNTKQELEKAGWSGGHIELFDRVLKRLATPGTKPPPTLSGHELAARLAAFRSPCGHGIPSNTCSMSTPHYCETCGFWYGDETGFYPLTAAGIATEAPADGPIAGLTPVQWEAIKVARTLTLLAGLPLTPHLQAARDAAEQVLDALVFVRPGVPRPTPTATTEAPDVG